MGRRKFGGNNNTIEDKFLRKILQENDKIFKYEVPLIFKAFKLTLQYFLENGIEFGIENFFKYVQVNKKEERQYLRYKDEYYIIPEHLEAKIKIEKQFKDYINERQEFENIRRREILPDNIRKKKDIF